jgi:hypothetical protein
LSGDTRKKMSESRKGRKLSDDTRKKISESHKGKEKTEEHRKNIGISGKGRMPHNKGIKSGPMSLELRKKHSEAIKGEKHPNWQGGKTPDSLRVRRSQDTRIWRESVFERDGYTCQECGKKGVYLHAHHIKRFSEYPELRFDLSNGITLCRDCHRGVHRKRSN